MQVSDEIVAGVLVDNGKMTKDELKELISKGDNAQKPLKEVVVSDNIISNSELTKLVAEKMGIEFAEVDPKTIDHESFEKLPERIARKYNAVIYKKNQQGEYQVAMIDPDDVQVLDYLKKQLGDQIKTVMVTQQNMNSLLDLYRENISSEISDTISSDESVENAVKDVDEEDLSENSPIAKTVNLVMEAAIRSKASDIHIEPRDKYISVRYRIDGVLREVNQLPKNVLNQLVARIKIISNLKIDERRAPQDGRFKIGGGDKKFAVRVSTLPVVEGEKVVMRLLDETNKAQTLEELGYWGPALEIINHAIVQPHGMILVTGPTGSGKSTSLFSMLSLLNDVKVNISTVEDPVEYRIPGVNQTQVNPVAGMTFANGLRALLRQDPNIIMVGEIRDGETAGLGVQAALTGHLVFSTLHTNNAATCLPRLLDMGVEPFLIASTVRCVVGQRLVRKLCSDCREVCQPDIPILDKIANLFGINSLETLAKLHTLEMTAFNAGLGKDPKSKLEEVNQLSTTEKAITRIYKAHEGGCESCGHSGYQGRRGIYEVLNNTSAVQQLIISNGTSEQIQEQAVKEGMVTMQYDGLIKALRGITSVEEILRVTSES